MGMEKLPRNIHTSPSAKEEFSVTRDRSNICFFFEHSLDGSANAST